MTASVDVTNDTGAPADAILRGEHLVKDFAGIRAVNDVSFSLLRGETLGVVGESGCGKTTLARLVMALESPSGGEVFLNGRGQRDWLRHDPTGYRRRLQYVFQDPVMSLNPRKTVAQILDQPLAHLTTQGRAERAARVAELMRLVGLRPEFLDRYPHQFSGGQCQRIGIARALATEPDVVVLDEPVSALDVSIQAQILNLLDDLQHRLALTYLFISHDLAVVENLSDRVLVMYRGEVVEQGSCRAIFNAPQQAYTKRLIDSIPTL